MKIYVVIKNEAWLPTVQAFLDKKHALDEAEFIAMDHDWDCENDEDPNYLYFCACYEGSMEDAVMVQEIELNE